MNEAVTGQLVEPPLRPDTPVEANHRRPFDGLELPAWAESREPRRSGPAEWPSSIPASTSAAIMGLFVIAIFFTVWVAKPILLPTVIAILLSFLLAPIVGSLRTLGLPRWVAAGFVLITATAVLAFGVSQLFGPAAEWMAEAPDRLERLEERVRVIAEPVEQVSAAAGEVEDALGGDAESSRTVALEDRALFDFLLDGARAFLGGLVVTFALVFFFLSSGDLFLRKLVRVLPTLSSRKRAVRVARRIRTKLSTHLLTVTVINTLLGFAVGGALALLGMPNPILWGAMAAVLNFIPYLGALAGVSIVAIVALTTFDDLGSGILAPAMYLALTAIEGAFITPAVLGRRMRLNPAAVFIAIMTLGWMWGIPGALLAVPIVSAVKVIADAYPGLLVVSEFLGR